MIVIKNYTVELEDKHIDFASRYWTKVRRKTPEYIYWKFRNKDKLKLTSFLLALDGEKVVGQLGLISCKIKIEDKFYDAQWACDLMVDKDYRGSNIANLLYERSQELKVITLGSDPSLAASKSMQKHGYKLINGPWKFFFPLNLGEIFKIKGLDYRLLYKIPNPFLILLKLLSFFLKNTFKEIEKNHYLEFEKKKEGKNLIYSVYDKEFIDWRFNNFKDYYAGIKTFGNIKGCSFSGYLNNKIFYLTDYCINKNIDFYSIISAIKTMHKSQNLSMIRFMSSTNSLTKLLQFSGFIKFRTRTQVIYYSIEPEIINLFENKEFYYTYLDSDEQI